MVCTLESQAVLQASWERHLLQESAEYIQERMEANFLKMMDAPGLCIPKNVDDITDDFMRESYEIATAYLKSLFEYIFSEQARRSN